MNSIKKTDSINSISRSGELKSKASHASQNPSHSSQTNKITDEYAQAKALWKKEPEKAIETLIEKILDNKLSLASLSNSQKEKLINKVTSTVSENRKLSELISEILNEQNHQ